MGGANNSSTRPLNLCALSNIARCGRQQCALYIFCYLDACADGVQVSPAAWRSEGLMIKRPVGN